MLIKASITQFRQERPRYSFYRLATIGWANPLLRHTLPLLGELPHQEFLVDLSRVELIDSFGLTYLAACLDRWKSDDRKVLVRVPQIRYVSRHLRDTGLYESVGLTERVLRRQAARGHVDLVHLQTLEPLFVDTLLDYLEPARRFAPGLRPSMRMSLLELVQNFAEHSQSKFGAWAAGQKYRDRITLCLLDLGQGIPNSLRTVGRYQRYDDPSLIELASEEGVSAVGFSRGLGLATIRRFVRVNGGVMTIISGKGRVRFQPDRRAIRGSIDANFPGTAVFLSLLPTRRGLFRLGDEEVSDDAN